MFLLLNVFLFYSFMLWKPCNSQYTSMTAMRLARKTNKLTEEIVKDAEMKVYSVQHLKSDYTKLTVFQYGTIAYNIGRRFKRMTLIYNQTLNKVNVDDSDRHVNKVTEMDNLAHEIMVLAEMIQLRENKRGRKGNTPMKLLRKGDAKLWQNLAENEDNNAPPELHPIVNNETSSGKRKNGVWHYAVPNDFNK